MTDAALYPYDLRAWNPAIDAVRQCERCNAALHFGMARIVRYEEDPLRIHALCAPCFDLKASAHLFKSPGTSP